MNDADSQVIDRLTYDRVRVFNDGREVVLDRVMMQENDSEEDLGIMFGCFINAICNADEPWPQNIIAKAIWRARDMDSPFRVLAKLYDEWDGEVGFAEYVANNLDKFSIKQKLTGGNP